ncbi:MAG: prepilin-type N-terminal cleavage/methylation domain-containing protein [Acidimicrobiales bacterium]
MLKKFVERTLEKRDEGGFTLIELLIVIIILAILAAIVVFAVGTTSANAKYSACNSDAKSFETAMESYKAQVGSYPDAGVLANTSYNTVTVTSNGVLAQIDAAPLTSSIVSNGTTLGSSWLRSLPGTAHYTIVTDGNGAVYVLPPFGTAGVTWPTITQLNGGLTVSSLYTGATQPGHSETNPVTNSLNFDTNPGVCSDANIVQ